MDLRYPNTLSTFLQIDPLGEYDECVMRKQLYLNSFYRNIPEARFISTILNIRFNRQEAVKWTTCCVKKYI